DSGYAMAGAGYFFQPMLVKIKPNGDTLWIKNYQLNRGDITSVIQTKDSGFILIGSMYVTNDTSSILAIKTDRQGNAVWSKFYKKKGDEAGLSIHQTKDNGYLLL